MFTHDSYAKMSHSGKNGPSAVDWDLSWATLGYKTLKKLILHKQRKSNVGQKLEWRARRESNFWFVDSPVTIQLLWCRLRASFVS
jgi:hypothetical protein